MGCLLFWSSKIHTTGEHNIIVNLDSIVPDRLVCPDDRYKIEYADTGGTRLYLECRRSSPGQGTYWLRYKANKKTSRIRIGRTPDATVATPRSLTHWRTWESVGSSGASGNFRSFSTLNSACGRAHRTPPGVGGKYPRKSPVASDDSTSSHTPHGLPCHASATGASGPPGN